MILATGLVVAALLATPAHAGWPGDPAKCKPDAVKAGSVCMDKYEASVWSVPATKKALITKIQNGTATLANLTAGGATQISAESGGACSPAFPAMFPANGQWTAGLPLYAVSIAGVHPTACVTWFQAQQACANARKRLPSNGEWQMAVAGTPEGAAGDDGSTKCNTNTAGDVTNTGSRSACISNYGAFDMVGNVDEWVADWMPRSTTCGSWGGSGDAQCLAGAATSGEPGALVRGGNFNGASFAPASLPVAPLEPPQVMNRAPARDGFGGGDFSDDCEVHRTLFRIPRCHSMGYAQTRGSVSDNSKSSLADVAKPL